MEKHTKIFVFFLLLCLTTMTTACVEEMKESKNNGDIIVENNENYTRIETYGIVDGDTPQTPPESEQAETSTKLIENCENNGNIMVNNNTYNSSTNSPTINVYGINNYNDEIKNCTNNRNIQVNDNSNNYNITPYGTVKYSINNIDNCEHTGKIIVNGTEQQ